MDTHPSPPIKVNYLYFGGFLILLLLMSASSVFLKDDFLGSRFFFLLYAFGQALLEVCGFIFLIWLLEKYIGRKTSLLFAGFTFFLALFHIIDFMLDRVLDLSVWNTLGFIFDENLHDFIYLLDASGLPLWLWAIFFGLIAALPLFGILLYRATSALSNRRPLLLKQELFYQLFATLPIALFLWDCSASQLIHPDAYTSFIKSLPWKFTFIQPDNVVIALPGPIRPSPTEAQFQASLTLPAPSKKPNIYLFVIESLREDFITPQAAPRLTAFRDQHIHFDHSLSNANGTWLSWFAIFHSQFSLYPRHYKNQNWTMGSPALQQLKNWGYKIQVYTSAQLKYYGMDQMILGQDHHLADSYNLFAHTFPKEVWESDQEAIQTLQKDLAIDPTLQEGQVFLIFWDSTHFDYSWPREKGAKFAPYAKEFAYFRAYQSKDNIELIKNRYRNAIHYVDSLFGQFWDALPNKEEAIVVVMGDHGEEFFEHGHLFHNSHLSDEQIRIPLYFKLGQLQSIPSRQVASQIDVFPTLIDYLCGHPPSYLQGESILRPQTWPFVLTVRFNGGRTPFEFSLHNGLHKLIAQFQNPRSVFSSTALTIRSLRSCKDGRAAECRQSIESWIDTEFNPAFERLFQPKNERSDN